MSSQANETSIIENSGNVFQSVSLAKILLTVDLLTARQYDENNETIWSDLEQLLEFRGLPRNVDKSGIFLFSNFFVFE